MRAIKFLLFTDNDLIRFLKAFDFEGVVDCAIVLHTMLHQTAQFVPATEAKRRLECLKNVE